MIVKPEYPRCPECNRELRDDTYEDTLVYLKRGAMCGSCYLVWLNEQTAKE